MYIEPNTLVVVLKNVPLDNTYDHTIYFADKTAQRAFFSTYVKFSLPNLTYQRVRRGVVRVGIVADNLYDCNYLMFQNSAFGSKWFYAFITGVEYVNNECSQITFELDVMQTWFFECEPQMCFVEREHSVNDVLFNNLVPEKLELGDYIISSKEAVNMGDMNVCALTSKTSEGDPAVGKTINHMYTPLNVIAGVPADDYAAINALLKGFVDQGKEDAVITMYQYPSWLGDASTTTPASMTKQLNVSYENIDGYVPKNKKLFSYPYNMLTVSNNNGNTANYRWEQFATPDQPVFKFTGVFISTPCVLMYPVWYRGVSDDYDSGLTISNFPQCSWVGDTFKRWFAQNKGNITNSTIASVVSSDLTMAAGALTGNVLAVAGGLTSKISHVTSVVAQSVDAVNTPPQVHGQIQCDSLNAGLSRFEFSFYHMCIRNQFARIIDDFFTMFGYATRQVKIPNRSSRPHWNYVKTIGCTVTGSVPADDMRKICQIYDNGITFWKNGDEIGDYSLDNSPS